MYNFTQTNVKKDSKYIFSIHTISIALYKTPELHESIPAYTNDLLNFKVDFTRANIACVYTRNMQILNIFCDMFTCSGINK